MNLVSIFYSSLCQSVSVDFSQCSVSVNVDVDLVSAGPVSFNQLTGIDVYSPSDGGGWSKIKVSFLVSSQSILKRFSGNFATIII